MNKAKFHEGDDVLFDYQGEIQGVIVFGPDLKGFYMVEFPEVGEELVKCHEDDLELVKVS